MRLLTLALRGRCLRCSLGATGLSFPSVTNGPREEQCLQKERSRLPRSAIAQHFWAHRVQEQSQLNDWAKAAALTEALPCSIV